MALLEIRDLAAGYGQNIVLNLDSLDVPAGQVVCVLGSNGAGKSTMMGAVVGTVMVKSGSIRFEGAEITRLPIHQRIELGVSLVPEGRQIFGPLTVEENLRLGAYSRRRDKSQSVDRDAVFELFPRLFERRKQLGGTLSGGEQQMLAIGRAMMSRPRLLLLDEPSLGLAPKSAKAILRTILEIASRGVGVLLVEQNARSALQISVAGYVLETGRVIVAGNAQQLASDPRVQEAYLGKPVADSPQPTPSTTS